MLKNSKVVLFLSPLKSWSGRKLLDPTTYIIVLFILIQESWRPQNPTEYDFVEISEESAVITRGK